MWPTATNKGSAKTTLDMPKRTCKVNINRRQAAKLFFCWFIKWYERNNRYKFTNNLGQRVLPIVDKIFGGLSYDLPKPGGIIVNDSLYANTVFPGLDIKYTLDGTTPDSNSNNFNTPIKIKDDDIVHLRLFDKTGRGGNNIKVNK